MKQLFLLCALALGLVQTAAAQTTTDSPDGRVRLTVGIEGGIPVYSVAYDGQELIAKSPLGISLRGRYYTRELDLAKTSEPKTIRDHYELPTIKRGAVDYEGVQRIFSYTQRGKAAIDIEFRVSNRDVAFRYLLPQEGETRCTIVGEEQSTFNIASGATAFLTPQAKEMTGFARTKPSYEEPYCYDEAPGNNGYGLGYTFPCLFRVADKGWVLISETGVDGSYCASRLVNAGGNLYKLAFPNEKEMDGWGSSEPQVMLPSATPWRTITVGNTLANIVETTVATDLVAPKYEASQKYTYGKGTWSWIIRMDGSCNFDEQKEYIDFAAAIGYRSVLVDALWDKQIGYKKVEQLAAYAKSKGVGLFLWYNSNGAWNNAPQGPRGVMSDPAARQRDMRWMQKLGVLGIKVDFFGSDKQDMIRLYDAIATDANNYGLQVIFHGCTLPRGWERMYPNYVASEAVLASENLSFGQGACDNEAKAACTHTFIRNVVGSMDFGGSALNKRYSKGNDRGTTRRTSDVFALATAVLFQSSVQHFAIAPNNIDDAPVWAMDFMKAVPTTWDDVRFIDGYPGKYAIIARKSGGKWYIAGINAGDAPIKKTITLPMLKAGSTVDAYTDDAKLQGKLAPAKVGKKQTVNVFMPKNGAMLIVEK